MGKTTVNLPDYSRFELLTEAVEFAAKNALESKQRADYEQLRSELEPSINPQNIQE
jgi:hypothetical protein